MKTFNFEDYKKGERYEDVYGNWLVLFQTLLESEEEVLLKNPPVCWTPFLRYMNINYEQPSIFFDEDKLFVDKYDTAIENNLVREYIEHIAVLRPELSDALFKYDCEWKVKERYNPKKQSFVITSNGSFFRPEIMEYMEKIKVYKNTKKKCILLPCAADKPYPSALHKKIKEMVSDEFEIIICTGVLGIIPESLWGEMPYYDSGIPCEWRLLNLSLNFFNKNHYDEIVVYLDYYGLTMAKSLVNIQNDMFKNTEISFVNPINFYYNYEDLLSDKNLSRLKSFLK